MTIWYSNLPEPDETNDAHWVDSGLGTIDLTVANTNTLKSDSKCVAWIRFKAVVAVSAASLYVWTCVEGDQ